MEKKDKFDWIAAQSWDEYQKLTKDWNDILLLRQRLNEQLDEWISEEKKRYEENIKPLMPYVNEMIQDKLELQRQKYGEELREMTPMELEGRLE